MNEYIPFFNIDELKQALLSVSPQIIGAIIILFVFWIGYILIRRPVRRILKRINLDEALINFLVDNMFRTIMFIFGLITAMSHLGVNISAALAGIGVVGIVAGFAAQDSLSNVIAGFLIFWDRPFQIGNWISIGNLYGKVVEITMRSTRIKTLENTYIVIPNQKIINDILVNHSKNGKMRINVPIGIAFKETVDDARSALLKALKKIPKIIDSPPPDVVVNDIGESSVNLQVRVWIDDASDEIEVRHATIEVSKKALDKAGIQIPFPHRQLFIDAVDEEIWKQSSKYKK